MRRRPLAAAVGQASLLALALASTNVACAGGGPTDTPAKTATTENANEGTATHPQGAPAESGAAAESVPGAKHETPAPKAPAVGTTGHETRSISIEFKLTLMRGNAAAGVKSGSWSMKEDRSLEVLETGKTAVTKLSVTYGKRESKKLLGKLVDSVTSGKAYVVASGGKVTTDDGSVAASGESKAVARDYPGVGEPSTLARIVAGATKEGEKLTSSRAAARALLGEIEGVDHTNTSLELTYRGTGGGGRPTAKVDVKARLRLVIGKTVFDIELSGPARIDKKTGWVTGLELDGQIQASGQLEHTLGPLDVRGKGSAKLERHTKF